MTGDGVNDVLALKDADCSIAMASGSNAVCQVAELVLLDSKFTNPSFILALEPNHELVKGKFMQNVLRCALPAA